MSLYTEILKLDEYFNSIRLHEGLLVIDLQLPKKWLIKEVINQRQNNMQIQLGASDDKYQIVSFFIAFDEPNTLSIQEEIEAVIKWNKDIEEKDYLLNQKMLELRKMFSENNIDSLRKLDINFKSQILNLHGEKQHLVSKGDSERRTGTITT